MPANRITMRRIREVLRLKHECALPNARIAAALGIAKGSVANYLAAAAAAGLTHSEALTLVSHIQRCPADVVRSPPLAPLGGTGRRRSRQSQQPAAPLQVARVSPAATRSVESRSANGQGLSQFGPNINE